MSTSQQKVIATLKSCLPIYHKLTTIPKYQPSEDEWGYITEFKRLWDNGWLDDDSLFDVAGIPFEEVTYLIGYASQKQN